MLAIKMYNIPNSPLSCSDGSMHIVKQSGYLETRVLCEQINKQTPSEMMAVVEKTSGWYGILF
jgi:hypothetical protein